jgi:peptidoglycan/LPS O-acetylase OafA/YrhL
LLGNSTYSIYLWHFPTQVCILIVVDLLVIDRAVFSNKWVFLLWIGAVIALARASFLYIERPLQALSKRAYATMKKRNVKPEDAISEPFAIDSNELTRNHPPSSRLAGTKLLR